MKINEHLQSAKMAGRLRSVGWDGANNPIVELRADCGCKWTSDGSFLLGTCIEALRSVRSSA